MNLNLKRTLMPGVLATSLVGATFLPAKPASADQNFLRDIGIGAATGVVSGVGGGATST